MNEPRSADSPSISQPMCDRVTCHREASVLLLFDPRLTVAWLNDIQSNRRTVGIALCLDHANRVTVPAGWTLTDERSETNRVPTRSRAGKSSAPKVAEPSVDPKPVRLASVTPIPEARSGPSDSEADGESVSETDADADAEAPDEVDEPTDDGEAGDGSDVAEPTLWPEDQPESLRVDESTPMLSRAFRAAHID
jgi:hypothetical protein